MALTTGTPHRHKHCLLTQVIELIVLSNRVIIGYNSDKTDQHLSHLFSTARCTLIDKQNIVLYWTDNIKISNNENHNFWNQCCTTCNVISGNCAQSLCMIKVCLKKWAERAGLEKFASTVTKSPFMCCLLSQLNQLWKVC